MPNKKVVPSYRLHKPSGLARVLLDGRHVYLGKYNSPESREEYRRLLAEMGSTAADAPRAAEPDSLTVVELMAAYLAHAKDYYPAKSCEPARITGARPTEICTIRPCDIDRRGDVWVYRPPDHKTAHLGKKRRICIGPKAQAVLLPYLLRADDAYCFSPAESEQKRLAERHELRRTPLSYGNRPGTNRSRKPRRTAGDHYTRDSYRRAIHRACDLAGIPRWSPNRLRHSAATEIRQKYGLEAAQVALGHARADVTQIYAERDMVLAERVMRESG